QATCFNTILVIINMRAMKDIFNGVVSNAIKNVLMVLIVICNIEEKNPKEEHSKHAHMQTNAKLFYNKCHTNMIYACLCENWQLLLYGMNRDILPKNGGPFGHFIWWLFGDYEGDTGTSELHFKDPGA
ncbi:hypothetical protein ACJX0J_016703, partial [Zea mays]